MESLTIKILDNSFISACMTDIKSVNIIKECDKYYKLHSSGVIYNESAKLSSSLNTEQIDC